MMPFGGLFSLLIFVLVVGVAIVVLRGLSGSNRGTRSPALEALQERYAKGELQREEYLQKKSDLSA